jgi:putative membrane protein
MQEDGCLPRRRAVILAQMMDWNDHHNGFGWGWVMVALLVVLLVAVTVLLVRHVSVSGGGPSSEPGDGRSRAEDVLAERLARGEIDEDEYRRRRAALRE